MYFDHYHMEPMTIMEVPPKIIHDCVKAMKELEYGSLDNDNLSFLFNEFNNIKYTDRKKIKLIERATKKLNHLVVQIDPYIFYGNKKILLIIDAQLIISDLIWDLNRINHQRSFSKKKYKNKIC